MIVFNDINECLCSAKASWNRPIRVFNNIQQTIFIKRCWHTSSSSVEVIVCVQRYRPIMKAYLSATIQTRKHTDVCLWNRWEITESWTSDPSVSIRYDQFIFFKFVQYLFRTEICSSNRPYILKMTQTYKGIHYVNGKWISIYCYLFYLLPNKESSDWISIRADLRNIFGFSRRIHFVHSISQIKGKYRFLNTAL